MKNTIQIVTCWGTIDKDYWSGKWIYDFHIWKPCIWNILTDLWILNNQYQIVELMREDSLDMKDTHRQILFEHIQRSDSEKIIITHGTDTIIDSWKYLWITWNKIIVLTWASRPYSMKKTDAKENILFAWNSLENILKPWVYIAMNSDLLEINNVQKCDDGIFRKVNY